MNSNINSKKTPWSYWTMIIGAILGGIPSGFLIVWQNLKRIGLEKEAKTWLWYGGIIWLIFIIYDLVSGVGSLGLDIALTLLPVHFLWSKYLKNWPSNIPKPKFSWDVFKWSLIGILVQIPITLLSMVIKTTLHAK